MWSKHFSIEWDCFLPSFEHDNGVAVFFVIIPWFDCHSQFHFSYAVDSRPLDYRNRFPLSKCRSMKLLEVYDFKLHRRLLSHCISRSETSCFHFYKFDTSHCAGMSFFDTYTYSAVYILHFPFFVFFTFLIEFRLKFNAVYNTSPPTQATPVPHQSSNPNLHSYTWCPKPQS